MNYVAEIRAFYQWTETNDISPAGIVLWHGLMFIANRSGWRPVLSIPVSKIELWTKLSRTSIYRGRRELKKFGLIDYDPQDGRKSSIYRINSLEQVLAYQIGTQDGTQNTESSPVVCQIDTQDGTQTEGQPPVVCQNDTQVGTLYKHKDISKKKKKTKEINVNNITTEPVWQNMVIQWLAYRQSISKPYRGEMSVRKWLSDLKDKSGDNPQTAQKIIDRSISRDWDGIFALPDTGTPGTVRPATGQRIGQIKQPDEERRDELLKKFNQST